MDARSQEPEEVLNEGCNPARVVDAAEVQWDPWVYQVFIAVVRKGGASHLN